MKTNFSLIAGLLLGIGLVAVSIAVEIGSDSARVFVHPVAMLIVLGGCIAASLISRPISDLWRTLKLTYYCILFPKDTFVETAVEITDLCRKAQNDIMFFDDPDKVTKNGLIAEALNTLNLGFPADEVRRHLERRRDDNQATLQEAADIYFALAKLGPAFGLLGTLVGLIVLLYFRMGTGEMTAVAGSMGIALTATLYGVTLSNLVFAPIGEYMTHMANQSAKLDEIIVEGALMLRERRHPLYVTQAMRAALPRTNLLQFETLISAQNGTVPLEKKAA